MRCLLATDGSPTSLAAARWVVDHLPLAGSELFVLYVFPLPAEAETYARFLSLPSDASDERVRQVAEPILERTMQVLAEAQATLHPVTLVGQPAEAIVELASMQRVDLVVMGHRGLGSRRELALGSTSNAVAHRALCPLLIVR